MKRSKGKMKQAEIRDLILNLEQEKLVSEVDTIHITVLAGSSRNLRPYLFLEAMAELEVILQKIRTMPWSPEQGFQVSFHLEPLSKSYSDLFVRLIVSRYFGLHSRIFSNHLTR